MREPRRWHGENADIEGVIARQGGDPAPCRHGTGPIVVDAEAATPRPPPHTDC